MAEKKLRFRAKIDGKEAGVVAAISPPVDVHRVVWDARARAHTRDDQRLCISLVADADGRLPHDAGE